MHSSVLIHPTDATTAHELSAARLAGLWLLGLLVLLAALGGAPVSRTQEARVLETSRQMLGTGLHGWLMPQLNGEPRLKKPPLAYWMTAAAYKVGGIGEAVGRLPNALIGWLTLGFTFALAARAFGQATALWSSAVLLGSFMFFRFTRLAETDAAAMLFITIAVYCLWRAMEDRRAFWLHLAAAATGAIVLAKGAPAIFVAVFLVALCAIEKRWDLLTRMIRSGAPLTFLVIAAPWFIYVERMHGSADVFAGELANTMAGGDHPGWPWDYIPGILLATAPWTGFLPLAVVDAARRWRGDRSVRFVLLWLAAILVPLCFNGNKQTHYLVMLTPPLLMLIGRLLAHWPANWDGWMRIITWGMIGIAALSAPAVSVVASRVRGHSIALDWVVAAGLLLCAVAGAWLLSRRSIRSVLGFFSMATCAALPVMLSLWFPSIPPRTVRHLAADIRAQYGDGPYLFYGPSTSLTLCFNLRARIPSAHDEAELWSMSGPGTVVLVPIKRRNGGLVPPAPFASRGRLGCNELTVDLFVLEKPDSESAHQSSVPRQARDSSSTKT